MQVGTLGPEGGVDCEISHRFERKTSANEDTKFRRGVD